jgi:hypothetical protein
MSAYDHLFSLFLSLSNHVSEKAETANQFYSTVEKLTSSDVFRILTQTSIYQLDQHFSLL